MQEQRPGAGSYEKLFLIGITDAPLLQIKDH